MRGVKLRSLRLWIAVGLGLVSIPVRSFGEPLARADVPEPLAPWVDWVLRGAEDSACALVLGQPDTRLCSFPARVELDLGANSGRFRAELRLSRAAWIRLPGDAALWPQDVEVDGKPAVVIARDGAPAVWLEPGRHVATGGFGYSALPEGIVVPPATALLAVRVGGAPLARPRRDPDGRVWLRARSDAETVESRLEVAVNRLVSDAIPLELETRIELRVSGAAREVTLGPVLPAGLVPISISSALPARLEHDGRLRVQMSPGDWLVTLHARSLAPVDSLGPPAAAPPWPETEIWAFAAEPSLRVVEVEGVPAVDPQQTTLPEAWRHFPAYALVQESTMALAEKRRGDADPAPDELALDRTLWLDFAGTGYTFHDRISGRLSRSWRLEMPLPSALGRVSVDGVDQLIGRISADSAPGVELRQSRAAIEADGRIDGLLRALPAVGWDHDFARVSATLQLPPGWRLFHVGGADTVSETWIRSWSLLDLFLVLVIALAIARLRSRVWGALALIALALLWPEPGAPRYAWLALLAAHALVRVLPEGRLRALLGFARLAALVLVAAIAVPFAITQVRTALYPALEEHGTYGFDAAFAPAPGALATTQELAEQSLAASEADEPRANLERRASGVPKSMPPRKRSLASYYAPEPGALVSTGPGLPSWTWRSVYLSWNGPVERSQEIRLWLVSPAANLALGWLRVALLIALLLAAADFDDRFGTWLRGRRGAAAALALLAFLVAPVRSARADEFPPADLLEQLRTRMLELPSCAPDCAESPRMRLEIDADRLRARIEIAVAARSAVPLPGGASDWSPELVSVNGAAATALARAGDGALWIELDAGLHQVVLEGPLPDRETVEIPLPLRPHRVEAIVSGWLLHGVHEDGRADASLQLARLARASSESGSTLEPGELPAFVRVERTLSLGILWEVETRVVRLSPAGKALFLELPLLAGESVTSAAVRVADGRAQVSLAPDATSLAWTSSLVQSDGLALAAPKSNLWVEVWRLDASPVWHVDVAGIPPIQSRDAGPLREREWRPWPGEVVELEMSRPEAVPGPTLTLDRAALHVEPGLRATDARLELRLRASRGSQHEVTLPEGAELQSVAIDGELQPIRQVERKVVLPIRPGAHTATLAWRTPAGVSAFYHLPQIGVGAPVVNVELELALPLERWVLAVYGPRLGPAVLFWSLLAVALLLAVGLSRVRLTPLGVTSWILLLVGLTQVPIWLGLPIVGWLLALGFRRAHPPQGDVAFVSLQVLLVLWTVVALAGLVVAIHQGLLGEPDMQIRGNGSTRELLRWYQDRSAAELPSAFALSVPMLVYRLAMLAWALWLAHALLGWLRFGWESFGTGGLWRSGALRRRRVQPRA
jgi:hypothetical protein